MVSGLNMTYPVSQATRGRDTSSHRMVRFEGVCAHFPLRDRGVDLDGVDLVGVRSGSGNSLGWPRVETIVYVRGVVFF